MPTINTTNGIDMGDISQINGQDVPSGGGGTATTTPTFTLDYSTVYLQQGITITNTSSYTNPQYKVVVTAGATTIAEIISTDPEISWGDNTSVSGTRTVSVTADEFGDYIESNAATDTYTVTNVQFRYYRLYASNNGTTLGTTSWMGIMNFRLYSAGGQSGTAYPPNLTSDTSGEASGYYLDWAYVFNSTYAAYKAFDSNTTGTWSWTLSVPSASQNYNGFYFDATSFPTAPTIMSATFRSYSTPSADYAIWVGSNTGAFAGEETVIHVFDMTQQSTNTTYNLG